MALESSSELISIRFPTCVSINISSDRYRNGDELIGTFSNGCIEGQGEVRFANKDLYQGEFLRGVKHGQGTYTYRLGIILYLVPWTTTSILVGDMYSVCSNGDIYSGEWREGVMQGQGDFCSQNGGYSYSGSFENGLRHGSGVLKLADGEVRSISIQ